MAVEPFRSSDVVPARALYGFHHATALKLGDRSTVDCFHGLAGGSDDVMVQSAGYDAVALAELVYQRWPAHRLARIDSCEDLTGPDAWPMLLEVVARLHERFPRVKFSQIGPRFGDSDQGTTIYGGSRKSRAFTRFYQKGLQLGMGDPTWCRAEIQVQPQSSEKMLFAGRSASDYWGVAAWTQYAHELISGLQVQRIHGPPPALTDLQRRFLHMRRQYGATFIDMSKLVGVDEAARQLLEPIGADDVSPAAVGSESRGGSPLH
jgi:hypothetical protein